MTTGKSKRNLAVALALVLACGRLAHPAAAAGQSNPAGSWRAKGDCFLAVIVLSPAGGAYLGYRSGEEEEAADWKWDGTILTIRSDMYDKDKFTGRYDGVNIAADFTWHDADSNTLHPERCVFEREKKAGR